VNVSFVPTDRSPVLPLLVNGEPEQVDEVRAKEILSAEDLEIRVDLGLGSESAKYWTCDFGYVSALSALHCFVSSALKCVFFLFFADVYVYDVCRSTLKSMANIALERK
jgi:ArgJ family